MTGRQLFVLLALLPITLGVVTFAVLQAPAARGVSPQRVQDSVPQGDSVGAPAESKGIEVSTAPAITSEPETPPAPREEPASMPAATPVESGEAMGPVLLANSIAPLRTPNPFAAS